MYPGHCERCHEFHLQLQDVVVFPGDWDSGDPSTNEWLCPECKEKYKWDK